MPAVIYRLLRLAWRYRRLVALALTILAGLVERHRSKLPGPLQKLDLTKLPGVNTKSQPAPDTKPAKK
ncbi:MAG: hypothetical protein HYX29_01535 [Solirubrobacterales bacterium]|nr:hypothetical protein [Solirubrobacterales bacterium]